MPDDSHSETPQMDPEKILATLSPDLYQKFRQAVEIGKWPNGESLTEQQKATCINAIIVYEHAHLDESERTGYMPNPSCPSHDQIEEPLNWRSSHAEK